MIPALPSIAVVIARDGRLPAGADEAVAEAGGACVLLGPAPDGDAGGGAGLASIGVPGAGPSSGLPSAGDLWHAPEVTAGPAALAVALAPLLAAVDAVILPASPDGRDLAPRLAAEMGRPLLAGAVRLSAGPTITADLLRVDGRVVVPVEVGHPVVATLLPGARPSLPRPHPPKLHPLKVEAPVTAADPEIVALIEPDPATMDLADARRVLGGGAGLVPPGATDAQARAAFRLLAEVAAAVGASMGATRVATDAGWTDHQRQIGTTGVAIDPDLYIAFGVSGASQHTGGLGAPRSTISINTDPSCPMTALADLGLVADALPLLLELADRLGVEIPPELKEAADARS